jgi:hypothetical protein
MNDSARRRELIRLTVGAEQQRLHALFGHGRHIMRRAGPFSTLGRNLVCSLSYSLS